MGLLPPASSLRSPSRLYRRELPLSKTQDWLKAERQNWTNLVQHVASFANQRIAAIDEELGKLAPIAGPLESQLESLEWEGPSSNGWWWVKKAEVPLAIEKETEKWGKGGFKGAKWHYFVASKDGNLLKKERGSQT